MSGQILPIFVEKKTRRSYGDNSENYGLGLLQFRNPWIAGDKGLGILPLLPEFARQPAATTRSPSCPMHYAGIPEVARRDGGPPPECRDWRVIPVGENCGLDRRDTTRAVGLPRVLARGPAIGGNPAAKSPGPLIAGDPRVSVAAIRPGPAFRIGIVPRNKSREFSFHKNGQDQFGRPRMADVNERFFDALTAGGHVAQIALPAGLRRGFLDPQTKRGSMQSLFRREETNGFAEN